MTKKKKREPRLHLHLFNYNAEYASGMVGAVAETPMHAVRQILEYSQQRAEAETFQTQDGYWFYLKPDNVLLEPSGTDREEWVYQKDKTVEVINSKPGILFFVLHDG